MPAQEFALFATAVGPCGIAWSARGIAGVQLPERSEGSTRARLQRRYPSARESAAPAHVEQAIDDIAALLRGNARDLSAVALDTTNVTRFQQSVYSVARGIPFGATFPMARARASATEGGTRGRRGVGAEPVSDHRAVSPRDGGWRQTRRLLCGRRGHDQTSPARHRGRASRRRAHAVRTPAAGRAAKPAGGRSVMAPKCSTP